MSTRQMRRIVYYLLTFVIIGAICCSASNDQTQQLFEVRYRLWKEWINKHKMASSYVGCKEFYAIVKLGVSAVPFIIEKMENNPEDFHLQCAINFITKRRFSKTEWPQNKLGDSITAARMYIKWWKEDRFKTESQFADFYGKWKTAKSQGNNKEAQSIFSQISNLGLPVLPYLAEKVEEEPDFIITMSKIIGNEFPSNMPPKQCEQWWKENKRKYELPAISTNIPVSKAEL